MNNIASVVVTLVLAAGGALLAYYIRNRNEQQQYEQHSSRRRTRCPPSDFTCSNCSICKEDFRSEGIELLPCGHIFHAFCIKEWFYVRFNCPTCRFDIPQRLIPEFRNRLNI